MNGIENIVFKEPCMSHVDDNISNWIAWMLKHGNGFSIPQFKLENISELKLYAYYRSRCTSWLCQEVSLFHHTVKKWIEGLTINLIKSTCGFKSCCVGYRLSISMIWDGVSCGFVFRSWGGVSVFYFFDFFEWIYEYDLVSRYVLCNCLC